MKEVPENYADIRKILLNQVMLIKQESEKSPDKLPELTDAMCEAIQTLQKV